MKKNQNDKRIRLERRHKRIRAKISGTAERPRLSVYKSNKFLHAQVINDEKGLTLAAITTQKAKKGLKPIEKAVSAAKELAEILKGKKLNKVVFDRGGFVYTGTIKVFADTLRESGLDF